MSMPLSGKATVDALADQWGKLMAFWLHKTGVKDALITMKNIEDYAAVPGELTIVVQELSDGIHVRLLPLNEALAEARKHKGGFGKS